MYSIGSSIYLSKIVIDTLKLCIHDQKFSREIYINNILISLYFFKAFEGYEIIENYEEANNFVRFFPCMSTLDFSICASIIIKE